jgi:hypothetical protein
MREVDWAGPDELRAALGGPQPAALFDCNPESSRRARGFPVYADALTREVIRRVQAEGTCWLGGTSWQGPAAMRVSVSSRATDESDVDRSAAAVLSCAGAVLA